MASTPRLTLRERRMLRAHVLDELVRLEETIVQLRSSLDDLDDDLRRTPATTEAGAVDPTVVAMRDHIDALLRQSLREWEEMRATQDRIEAENFGFCEICHEFIGVDRLLAMPTSPRCIRCAN